MGVLREAPVPSVAYEPTYTQYAADYLRRVPLCQAQSRGEFKVKGRGPTNRAPAPAKDAKDRLGGNRTSCLASFGRGNNGRTCHRVPGRPPPTITKVQPGTLSFSPMRGPSQILVGKGCREAQTLIGAPALFLARTPSDAGTLF